MINDHELAELRGLPNMLGFGFLGEHIRTYCRIRRRVNYAAEADSVLHATGCEEFNSAGETSVKLCEAMRLENFGEKELWNVLRRCRLNQFKAYAAVWSRIQGGVLQFLLCKPS